MKNATHHSGKRDGAGETESSLLRPIAPEVCDVDFQAREELAAKTSEVAELQSRLGDLEKQQTDRQRLIDMQNSQMKALQDRYANDKQKLNTLGEVFVEWGVRFDGTCVGGYCPPQTTIAVYVDGTQVTTDPRQSPAPPSCHRHILG